MYFLMSNEENCIKSSQQSYRMGRRIISILLEAIIITCLKLTKILTTIKSMMNQPYVDQSQSIHKYFGSGYERLPANGSENGVYDDISDFQFHHFLCQDDFYLIKNKSFVPSMLWNKVGTFEYAKKGSELRISIVQSEFSSRN